MCAVLAILCTQTLIRKYTLSNGTIKSHSKLQVIASNWESKFLSNCNVTYRPDQVSRSIIGVAEE